MKFFDPNAGAGNLFEMGGTGHLVLVAILFGLLGVMIAFRRQLPRLRASRSFMAGTAGLVLGLEILSYAFKFIYPFSPGYERIPLHLCASLKIAVALLILLDRYDLAKFISIWAIGCGFISFANLNLEGQGFGNFMFWHYLIGHYYLFLAPIFLFLTGDFRYDNRYHARSLFGLFVWSLIIFFVNWIFDANYMYFGPHNTTSVPFVPAQFMVWPYTYVSYVVTGLILLNLIYGILRLCQWRMDSRLTGGAIPAAAGA